MCHAKECYLREVGFGYINNKNERGFCRGNYIPYHAINIFANKHNRFSVFCSAYRYNVKQTEKALLYGDLYLDFDNVDDFSKAQADAITALSYLKICYHISEDNIKIYFSGNKGIHLIVPAEILGIEPSMTLNHVFKYIATSIKSFTKFKTIDTQIYDNRRLFRIPNTIHEKSNLYKIPLTSNELRTLNEDNIREMACSQRVINYNKSYATNVQAQQQFKRMVFETENFNKQLNKNYKYKTKYNFIPPCIQYILDNGAPEGQRNITIACLSCFCKNYGKSLDESIEFISDWNSKNIKPTGQQELKKTVRSLFLSDKQFGCSTLKTISICNASQCKLAKKERRDSYATRM